MSKFNFKPGDRVKLSDGSVHVFLANLKTLMGDEYIALPLITFNDHVIFRWRTDGTRIDSDVQLLPPEDWRYGTITEEGHSDPIVEWWERPRDAIRGIPFRIDFGRGVVEQLEDDND